VLRCPFDPVQIAILGYEVLEPGLLGADQIAFGALAIGANILREI